MPLKHAKKNELNSPVKKEAPVQNEMQKDLDQLIKIQKTMRRLLNKLDKKGALLLKKK